MTLDEKALEYGQQESDPDDIGMRYKLARAYLAGYGAAISEIAEG